jgi:AcrR family transcriptional regulator
MYGYYCDHYVNYVKVSYDKAVESQDINQGVLLMARTIAEYSARYKYIFIFSLIEVYGDRIRDMDILKQLAIRGMDVKKHWFFLGEGEEYPSRAQLIMTGITFLVTLFHKGRSEKTEDPTEEEIQRFVAFAEGIISHGLGFDKKRVDALDFEGLEKIGNYQIPPEGENEGLLKAVAGAVAQAGPWNASMDMVAKRSGLSKSGLYSHFKSKQDMIGQMFLTEFDRIVDYAELGKSRSAVAEEQFYLVLTAIANYLRSRPEILITLDWIRTRRLDPGISVPPRIYRIFADIQLKPAAAPGNLPESSGEADAGGLELAGEALAQWVLFLIINILMKRPEGLSFSDLPNTSFRILYKFIVLGIEG